MTRGDRPRLLVVTERYWPDGSGGELATHLILDILRERFNVTVLTGTARPARLPGVRYIYEPLLSRKKKIAPWLNSARPARSARFLDYSARTTSLMSRDSPIQ